MKKLLFNRNELEEALGCGRQAAIKIGTEAGAVVYIGSKRFFRADIIEQYIRDHEVLCGRIRTN